MKKQMNGSVAVTSRGIRRGLKRGLGRQAGATIENFMLWAIIAAGIALVYILAFNRGSGGQVGSDFVKEFNELAANSSNAYTGQWAQFTTANAEKSGLFNGFSTIQDAGGGVVNIKGGGTLTVAPGTVQSANDAGQYTIVGFAQEGCKKVIQGVACSAATMTLNGTSVKAFGGKFDPTASCNSTNNTIVVKRQ